ncbi:MAG: cysteine peptidase family C39 domain-containing protein [Fimbriimonadaceae bacterium]
METRPIQIAVLAVAAGCGPSIAPAPEYGCGPRALAALAARIRPGQTEADTLRVFEGERRLSTFLGLKTVGQRLGLELEGFALTEADLRRLRPRGILHVDGNHFVALLDAHERGVDVIDPAIGSDPVRWTYGRLRNRWQGRILLEVRP